MNGPTTAPETGCMKLSSVPVLSHSRVRWVLPSIRLLSNKVALLREGGQDKTFAQMREPKRSIYRSLRSFQMFSIGQRLAQAVSIGSRYVLVALGDGCVSIRSSTTKPDRRKSRIQPP